MTAVNDHCKQSSFFVVNDWGTAVYGRARSTWESLQHDLIPTEKVLNEGQINQLRLEVEEKLVEFENNFLTVTDKDLFKKKIR
jgi:hypothetical protein